MNNAATKSAADLLAEISYDVRRMGGNGAGFAYSMDAIDHTIPHVIRRDAMTLARAVAVAGDEELTVRAHVALCWACQGDDWAEKEVAGRFLSAVRRVLVLRAIAKHPRADRFYTLRSAIERGRFSKAQWQLACRLAKEAA